MLWRSLGVWVIAALCLEGRAANVSDFGAIPNDGKDDQPAIQKAIDAAAGSADRRISFPAGVLQLHSQIVVRSGLSLDGHGTILRTVGAVQNGVLVIEGGATNVTIAGLSIEVPLCHTGILNAGTASRLTFRDLQLSGSIPHTNFLVSLDGRVSDVVFERVTARTALSCFVFRDAVNRLTLRDVEVNNWRTWGILLRITSNGPNNITIDNYYAHSPAPGKFGAARQMIATYADPIYLLSGLPVRCSNLQIANSRCIGPYEPWDKQSDSSRGTADQIVLHFVDGFSIHDVMSVGGGENNITIAMCANGSISNLHSTGADAHGIQIGAVNYPCSNINLVGGFIGRNGLRKDRNSRDTMASVYLQKAARCSVSGALIVDDDPRHQKYGINVSASTEISLGSNTVLCNDESFQPIAVFSSTLVQPSTIYPPMQQTEK